MRRFPASTTVAVLTFPSLHRIDVPDVANDDAEDITRDIEWPLRAFASMRAVRLFLRARAVINFLMRAVSTSQVSHHLESLIIKTLFCAK